MLQLTVLYPQPVDAQQFESDYLNHIALFHEKTGIPTTVIPYTVTKFLSTPEGAAHYYQMFSMPFDSMEILQATMTSPEMQEIAADANRISTGGPITVLIGNTQ
jgi:uncharacterized protein (TIGR02118 family)